MFIQEHSVVNIATTDNAVLDVEKMEGDHLSSSVKCLIVTTYVSNQTCFIGILLLWQLISVKMSN
ncbi:CLUMA_CG011072, isoform A [Clunio marinus]|uniref:CLUMA_CG011072, isoform A n=1 Tax=Clunio marinus TaxID=568069 RepID=A0A1J1IDR2_9DIPT|nr:CLUMA_CG011072, isoform A [Clunio marinus]